MTIDMDDDKSGSYDANDPFLAELCKAIGLVELEFNWLEYDVCSLIARLRKENDIEAHEYGPEFFSKKLDRVKKECKKCITDKSISDQADVILAKLWDIADRRNLVAHTLYMPILDQKGSVKKVLGRSFRENLKPLEEGWAVAAEKTPREMLKLAEDIQNLSSEVRNLAEKVAG